MRVLRCLSIVLLAPVLLTSCYSLAKCRMDQRVSSPDTTVVFSVWVNAPGPPRSSPRNPVLGAITAVGLYPYDVVFSTCGALAAPFDPDLSIRWGPLGAVAAITLPGVTLVPYIYGPLGWDIELEQSAFQGLINRCRTSDATQAYREIAGGIPLFVREDSVISAEPKWETLQPIIDETPPWTAARPLGPIE